MTQYVLLWVAAQYRVVQQLPRPGRVHWDQQTFSRPRSFLFTNSSMCSLVMSEALPYRRESISVRWPYRKMTSWSSFTDTFTIDSSLDLITDGRTLELFGRQQLSLGAFRAYDSRRRFTLPAGPYSRQLHAFATIYRVHKALLQWQALSCLPSSVYHL